MARSRIRFSRKVSTRSTGNHSGRPNLIHSATLDNIPDSATIKNDPFSLVPVLTSAGPSPTYSIIGSLPTGLSISPTTGTISGTPTVNGTSSGLQIRVLTIYGLFDSNTFSIEVYTVPSINAISNQSSTSGHAYSFTPTVLNSSGFVVVYSVVGGLPTGLSINSSTGEISGTPSVVGTTSGLKIRIVYTHGTVDSNSFDFNVASNAPPASPTMWWRLDQLTGATSTVDSSGNGRTATTNPTDWTNPGAYFPANSFNGYSYTPASDLTGSAAVSHATLSVISTFDNPPTTHFGEVNGGLPNGYAGIAVFDPGFGIFAGNLNNVGPFIVFASAQPHDPATYANTLQATFTAGVRTMWTITYSGTTLKLYKDGVLMGTRSSVNIDASNATLRLAVDNAGGAAGGIYEHFITYDRALSDAEVLALYVALA